MDCQKFHHKISEQRQVILILKLKLVTLNYEYVTLLDKHLDGGSGGPIGRILNIHGVPFPIEFDPQQRRVPKSSSVLGVYLILLENPETSTSPFCKINHDMKTVFFNITGISIRFALLLKLHEKSILSCGFALT